MPPLILHQPYAQRRAPRRPIGLALGMMMALSLGVHAESAAPATQPAKPSEVSREYRIKAAFLYQFSRYVEWPVEVFESPEAPFVIGVYGENPFGDTLKKLAEEKKVGSRPLVFRPLGAPGEVSGCHVLFLSRELAAEAVEAVLGSAREAAVLVVSDVSGFVERGGHVQFFLQDNKVRFAFHEGLSEGALRVSSKLLSLSKPAPPTTEAPY